MNTTHPIKVLAVLLSLAPFASADLDDATDYLGRGIKKERSGDLKGAVEEYNLAIEVDPQYSRAYFSRGNARRELGELDAAIEDFNRAIELDPEDALPYNNCGVIKRMKGDLDGALACYERAIELDPKYALAYRNRGSVKQAKGDLEAAIADYDRAIGLRPSDIENFLNRAMARQARNDVEGAIADCESALQINPDHGPAYQSRGIAKTIKRDWAEALADYRQFCELSEAGQDYPQVFIWMVQARLGKTEAANKELAEYLDKRPKAASGDWVSNVAGHLLGKVTEEKLLAAAASRDAEKERGQQCEAWFYSGMKKLLAGDKEAAIGAFRKCLETKQRAYIEYQFAEAELRTAEGKEGGGK